MNSLVAELVIAGVCSLVVAAAGALFFRMELGAALSTTWLIGRALPNQRDVAKAHRVRTRAYGSNKSLPIWPLAVTCDAPGTSS